MAKANKQVIIDTLVNQIEKGKGYTTVMKVNGGNWGLSRSTFDRYWKIANQQHKETQSAIKKAKAAIDIQNGINERTRQIASVAERKEILTKIVRGQIPLSKPMVVGGKLKMVKTVPDWMDRKAAIAELNKMEGDYAPDKVANVTADGQDVAPVQLLSDAQFSTLIKTINEAGTS